MTAADGTAPEVSDAAVEAAARALARDMTDEEWHRASSVYRSMHRTSEIERLTREADEAIAQAERWSEDAMVLKRERDALAQAIHDGRGILGFDNDGDTKPHTSDFQQYAEHWRRDAAEERRDRDELSDEVERAERETDRVREQHRTLVTDLDLSANEQAVRAALIRKDLDRAQDDLEAAEDELNQARVALAEHGEADR